MNEPQPPSFDEVENEPTPYGIKDTAPVRKTGHTQSSPGIMHRWGGIYTVIGVAILGGIGLWLIHDQLAQTPAVISTTASPSSTIPVAAASPSSTQVTLIMQTIGNGTQFSLQWNNLPAGTAKINVFYSATATGTYVLVGSLTIAPSSLTNGNGSFTVPGYYRNGYYYETTSNGGGNSSWSSSPTPEIPVAQASSPSSNAGQGNSGSNNASGNRNIAQGENNTSTTSVNVNNGDDNTNGDTGGSPSSSGQNFLVQHFDKKIQISWQSLPSATVQVAVSRATSTAGPWNNVLVETNVTNDGPYSIEVVDDTLGDPYYYEMNVYDASGTTIAAYGPLLLGSL